MVHYNSTIRFGWKPVLDNGENVWHQMTDDHYIIKFGISLALDANIDDKMEIMKKAIVHNYPYLQDINYVNTKDNDFGEVKEDPFDSPNASRTNSSVILHYHRKDIEKIMDEKPHLFV